MCKIYQAVLAVLLLPAAPTHAAILIDVRDAFINSGGTGSVDVFVSTNGPTLNVDFGIINFGITTVGNPSTVLEFADPQDTSEASDPNYLFAGDSFGIATDVLVAGSELEQSDFTDSGNGISLTTTPRLFARLDLQHILGPGQSAGHAIGEQFRIVPLDNGFTVFEDSGFNGLDIDARSFDLNGIGGGTITAVPEPAGVVVLSLGSLAGMLLVQRRRAKING